MTRSSPLLERIVGGIALVTLALTLALAGCDEAPEATDKDDRAVDVDIHAPGVDVEVDKPAEGE